MHRPTCCLLAVALLGACATPSSGPADKSVSTPVARLAPATPAKAPSPLAKKTLLGMPASDGRRIYVSDCRNHERVRQRIVGLFSFNAAQVEAAVKKLLAEPPARR